MNVTQYEMAGFSQPAVASFEKRKDMKISTLLQYLAAIGMGVEIRVFPKKKKRMLPGNLILLKS
jgi:hypothetical protein